MNDYKTNPLKKYIEDSKLITINEYFKIRIASSLYEKYINKNYDKGISYFNNYIDQIRSLNIKYPSNANPIFYMYIVPDDNFKYLLGFNNDLNIKGGGRPVVSYDLDGFETAYGVSSNIVEERNEPNVMQNANSIHEFAHLVHSMFFQFKNRYIAEGIAEAITFYNLNYENKFNEYHKCLKELSSDKILSAKELIQAENNFECKPLLPNASCSFKITYISSYLFIRGCIETIEKNFNMNKNEAIQNLLEILRQSQNINEWLIFDIANEIGINKEELLYEKKLQINILNKL